VIRELTKGTDEAKKMLRVIKVAPDTIDNCPRQNPMRERGEWDLVSGSNSDWAGNPDTSIVLTILEITLSPNMLEIKGPEKIV
jgi:hypothetical protein